MPVTVPSKNALVCVKLFENNFFSIVDLYNDVLLLYIQDLPFNNKRQKSNHHAAVGNTNAIEIVSSDDDHLLAVYDNKMNKKTQEEQNKVRNKTSFTFFIFVTIYFS